MEYWSTFICGDYQINASLNICIVIITNPVSTNNHLFEKLCNDVETLLNTPITRNALRIKKKVQYPKCPHVWMQIWVYVLVIISYDSHEWKVCFTKILCWVKKVWQMRQASTITCGGCLHEQTPQSNNSSIKC